ncbi:MAG: TetR/AcrR family transcriptional regulator C-terminal domain-containing protein [Actinomycetota bacterium]
MAQQTEAPQRVRLSRDRVLRAAVVLADQTGIEGLSMRHLAQELGVVPMALYKHVASKEDLLDGMVDIVFSEIDFPSRGADWRTAMRERATSTREALLRHRWANGLMESRTRPGPANLRYHNSVMACLREAGFSFDMAVHAYSALDSYTYGFALQEKTLPFETPEESAQVAEMMLDQLPPLLAEEYPYLVEVVAELGKSGYDYAKEFEFALDLILDGIERLPRQDVTPTGGRS